MHTMTFLKPMHLSELLTYIIFADFSINNSNKFFQMCTRNYVNTLADQGRICLLHAHLFPIEALIFVYVTLETIKIKHNNV